MALWRQEVSYVLLITVSFRPAGREREHRGTPNPLPATPRMPQYICFPILCVCLFSSPGERDNECVLGVRVGKVAKTLKNIKFMMM